MSHRRCQPLAQTLRLLSLLLLVLTAACSSDRMGPSELGKSLLLAESPEAAKGVVVLKTELAGEAPPEGSMVVIGRVGGGSHEAFDSDQATFLLRDQDLEVKSHDHDGNADNCKFCQAQKSEELKSMALVRMVDADGKVISQNAQQLLGIRKDQLVIAVGSGSVDEVGTFVFDATNLFVSE